MRGSHEAATLALASWFGEMEEYLRAKRVSGWSLEIARKRALVTFVVFPLEWSILHKGSEFRIELYSFCISRICLLGMFYELHLGALRCVLKHLCCLHLWCIIQNVAYTRIQTPLIILQVGSC